MSKLIIGSHISMCAPEYFLGSIKESILNGANTLMFLLGLHKIVEELQLKNVE